MAKYNSTLRQLEISKSLRYRPEIDGLRAISVASVILFHANVSGFSGGFVGVDIFFVISGYLIGGILLSELQESGSISLSSFYERRARRILPVYLAMLIAVLATGLFILSPADLMRTAKDAIASIFFSSNIIFMQTVNYFENLGYRSLLHTWSLSVEEQFYIAFPLLLGCMWRYQRTKGNIFFLTFLIAGFSFAGWIVGSWYFPRQSFFFSPFRAWELIAGFALHHPRAKVFFRTAPPYLLGWLGMALIGVGISQAGAWDSEGGGLMLVPVVGAMLILGSGGGGNGTLLLRLLSMKPVLGLGLISYSLYLWHLPVFVFFHIYWPFGLSAGLTASILVGLIILSALSWKFVEQPFRRKSKSPQRIAPLWLAAGALAVTMLPLAAVIAFKGIPERFSLSERSTLDFAQDFNVDRMECFDETVHQMESKKACKSGLSQTTPATVALLGDSHAEMLRTPFDAALADASMSGVYLGGAGCPVLLNLERLDNKNCAKVADKIIQKVILNPKITTVILANRWPAYVEGSLGLNLQKNLKFRYVGDRSERLDQATAVKMAIQDTVDILLAHGKNVHIIGSVPEMAASVPQAIFYLGRESREIAQMGDKGRLELRNANASRILKGIDGIVLHDPATILCPASRCEIADDRILFYSDDNHLSRGGAMKLQPLFNKIMRGSPVGQSVAVDDGKVGR